MGKKATTIIFDRLYDRVTNSLNKNKNQFINEIKKFLDNNSEALFSNNLGQRVFYNTKFEGKMFELCGVAESEISEAINSTNLNDKSWYHRNRPIYVLLFLVQRYFDDKKKKEEKKLILMMFSVVIYSGRQKHFFPFNSSVGFDNVMQYTVNNLSNKYLLKQKGNVYSALEATTFTVEKTYEKLLNSKKDEDIFIYIINMVTRVHNFVKNIAEQFYENKKSGKYLNLEKSTNDKDGSLIDVDNVSFAISSIVEKTFMSLKTNRLDGKIVRLSAHTTTVSQLSLANTLNNIIKNEEEDLKELLRLILVIFLVDKQKPLDDICSTSFVLEGLQAFSKSHTKEENVINLKETLDKFLKEYSDDYNKTQRQATKSNFRKAVYLFFLTYTQSTFCNK